MNARAARFSLLFGVCIAMGACTAKSKIDAASAPEPAFVLLDESPANGVVRATDVLPLEPGTQTYLRVGDDGQIDGQITIKREPTTRFGAAISISDNEGRTQFLRTDEQGNVVMTAVIEEHDQAISLFDPPIVVAFAELSPGPLRTSESTMRVVDSKNPAKQREAGKATRSMRYVGDQKVRTPSGEFLTKLIEVHFTADLKLADADEKTTTYVLPGAGVIAEVSAESVKVFGAFGKTVHRTVVLDRPAMVKASTQPAQLQPATAPDSGRGR